jgi:hypothetical protein
VVEAEKEKPQPQKKLLLLEKEKQMPKKVVERQNEKLASKNYEF